MPFGLPRLPGWCLVFGLLWLLAAPLTDAAERAAAPRAAASAPVRAVPPAAEETVISLSDRPIAGLRATVLGDSPAARADFARAAIDAALAKPGPGKVSHSVVGESVRFEIDGVTVFFLVPDDLAGARSGGGLEAAAQAVEFRLQVAVLEMRERTDPRLIMIGLAFSAVATIIAILSLRGLFALRRFVEARVQRRMQAWRERQRETALATTYEQTQSWLEMAIGIATWGLVVLLVDAWFTFALRQFAYTRAWGEHLTDWLLDLLSQFALAIADAAPGLVVVVLIFAIARSVARATSILLLRVERRWLRLSWLDADTAGPTRRLGVVLIWLFAVALAYPYLPGASSDAFKGVTVLAGLMLSLGAQSMVGQALSGLSLMYARALRVGEYVRVGDVEGTVMSIGLLATKIHTGMGEEVSLPSTLVSSQPVRNFSRLVREGQFVLQTSVTIGYGTPWRLVHKMLLDAVQRTGNIAADPAPFVVQTALSDFYIEYRVCAQSTENAPRRRADARARLHAHIQDVFNENGVQIMSPHYMADPPAPLVVPPDRWGAD